MNFKITTETKQLTSGEQKADPSEPKGTYCAAPYGGFPNIPSGNPGTLE